MVNAKLAGGQWKRLWKIKPCRPLHCWKVEPKIITFLYLSVSTRAVIGQFCGSSFTLWNFLFPRAPINLRGIINILLTSFSRSVLLVTNPRFSRWFMAHALRAWAISEREKTRIRNLQYGPRTRLVRGINQPLRVRPQISTTPDVTTNKTNPQALWRKKTKLSTALLYTFLAVCPISFRKISFRMTSHRYLSFVRFALSALARVNKCSV